MLLFACSFFRSFRILNCLGNTMHFLVISSELISTNNESIIPFIQTYVSWIWVKYLPVNASMLFLCTSWKKTSSVRTLSVILFLKVQSNGIQHIFSLVELCNNSICVYNRVCSDCEKYESFSFVFHFNGLLENSFFYVGCISCYIRFSLHTRSLNAISQIDSANAKGWTTSEQLFEKLAVEVAERQQKKHSSAPQEKPRYYSLLRSISCGWMLGVCV